jgi:chemotaxis signal transduction protein
VIGELTHRVGEVSTSGDGVPATEELVVVRAGHWRMLLPVCHIQRVHQAALPAARPGSPPLAPVISVEGSLLPVAFAASLAGASSVEMRAHHQLVELAAGERRGLLWVDAVEDVVSFEPAPGGSSDDALVAGWSGAGRPLPILDVPRLLDMLG